MRKRFITLDGTDFYQMVFAGAQQLHENVDRVNALNVFPVPDGDTGTNMNLTMASGVEALNKKHSVHIGQAADALSKGLLMGARGNSGVILSQLFRGFAKSVHDFPQINAQQFAAALQNGVDMAYNAVIKPVEGTILTVSKEAAKRAMLQSRHIDDIEELMREVLLYGKAALAHTPELLPILKQVGVVDAGGQGLICIYEGFLSILSGEKNHVSHQLASHQKPIVKNAQSMVAAESIEHGYCTEFIVKLAAERSEGPFFQESKFRHELSAFGDSLLVVADDDLVKVHIHAEFPGQVMNHAMKFGQLTKIKIENMREQHSHIVHPEVAMDTTNDTKAHVISTPIKPYGFVAVGVGEGIAAIFRSLGVDVVLMGGQTMNPSTEDLIAAVKQASAHTVFILPNNANIILAAQQARDLLVHSQEVVIIPAKTIPQGMTAMVAFHPNADLEHNTRAMISALDQVRSGQVTYAVRDTEIEGMHIRKGDWLGMLNNQIVNTEPDLIRCCKELLTLMLAKGGDIVTLLTGEEAEEKVSEALIKHINQLLPAIEVEVHPGGQPIYPYIISVE